MQKTTTIPTLDSKQRQQCLKNVTFRLNCMLTWDLFVFIKDKFKNDRSVYATGHLLDPALEISSVFGRQLLGFLKIKKHYTEDRLIEYFGKEDDDVTIESLYPTMTTFPLQDELTTVNEIHLVRLIKVANKATAHFTLTETTYDEFESMKTARQVIFELVLKYIPDIDKNEIRWIQRDNYKDALIENQ